VTIYYQLQDKSYRTAVFIAIAYLIIGLLYFALKGRHRLILSPEEEFALEHETSMTKPKHRINDYMDVTPNVKLVGH
jgi:ethanolamine permease